MQSLDGECHYTDKAVQSYAIPGEPLAIRTDGAWGGPIFIRL